MIARNLNLNKSKKERRQGHIKDALALGGDEGRDKLRKAACRGKYPLIRGCPNGATHLARGIHTIRCEGKPGELKHLSSRRKRKQNVIPQVEAIERGGAQTTVVAMQHVGL